MKRAESIPGVGRIVAWVRSSYRRKLAAVLLVVLLIIGAASLGLYLQISWLLGDSVERSMTAAANAEADELTEWTRQKQLVTHALSAHPVYESGDDAEIREYLDERVRSQRKARLTNAYIIDRRNQTVETSLRRELEGTSLTDLPWEEDFAFRAFDDVRVTQPYRTEDGTTEVGFITPIQHQPGKLLVVTVNAASIFERFEHPVDGGFTRVVDSNGTVVFADDPSVSQQQYHSGALRAPIVGMGIRGESGFRTELAYERSRNGSVDYVAAFAHVDGTDWVLIEHAPASEAYEIRNRVRTWIGIVGVVSLVAMLGVVALVGADVTGAVSRLTDRAERIEGGQYDVTFETDRPDEFGDLNRTLASTRDTLQERFEKIRETSQALKTSNTALKERTEMVSVLNRIVRHNVRNDVNIISGHTEFLSEAIDDDDLTTHVDSIQETAQRLATISGQSRRINELLADENAERVELSFPECLAEPIADVRSSFEDATIRVHVRGSTPIQTSTVATFPYILADVVEQLVEHNGGSVVVDVYIEREPTDGDQRSVVIRIDDDGVGLPALDVRAISAGEVTPLNHGEGLALWCLAWTVDKSGGDLVVDSDDSTVEVRLSPGPEETTRNNG